MPPLEDLAFGRNLSGNVAPVKAGMVTTDLGSMKLEWGGEGFKEKVAEAAARGVTDAAAVVARYAKRITGIQGPPTSRPGFPPRMDTTSHNRAITISEASPASLVAYAGIAADARNSETGVLVDDYALELEFGSTRVQPRPWLVQSMLDNRRQMFAAFTTGAREVLNA